MVAWLVSRGLWYQWTRAALPYLRGNVLELGCGTGYMQSVLAAEYDNPSVGLDVSPSMLTCSRMRARRVARVVRLVRGQAERLPFASGSVASVLSTFPSSYIIQPDTLREIQRVLMPAGRLVIVDAAYFPAPDLYERAIALLYRVVSSAAPITGAVPERHFYQDLLEPAGFTVDVHTTQVARSVVKVFVAQRRPTTVEV